MKSYLASEIMLKPFLKTRNEKIIEAGQLFLELTGYSMEDILNKPLSLIFQHILRINQPIDIMSKGFNQIECVLFSKALEAIEVIIQFHPGVASDERICIIQEKPNSRLEDRILFIKKFLEDEKVGVGIYSVPDFILLKANDMYLKQIIETIYLSNPIEQGQITKASHAKKRACIGQRIRDFVPNFQCGRPEKTWNNIVQTNETLYLSERKGLLGPYDERYWDNTLMPIDENGKVKFVISILEDVTDRVQDRLNNEEYQKTIEKQALRLKVITENMNDALFILNSDGTYDYFNDHAKKMTEQDENIKKIGDSLVQ